MKPLFLHVLNALWNDPAAAQHWLFGLGVLALLYFAVFRWPVMQPVRHALWNDEAAVKRWAWGAGGFLMTMASMVFIGGVEQALTWTARQWAANIITALIALVMGMVNPAGKPRVQPEGAAPTPQAGFVRVAVLAALLAGVLQAVLVAMAMHSIGLNSHALVLFGPGLFGATVAWLVVRAFPAPPLL